MHLTHTNIFKKKSSEMSFVGKWMEMEIITLSKIIQTHQNEHILSPMQNVKSGARHQNKGVWQGSKEYEGDRKRS